MNNDMSHSSVTVYTARRRNKSIWMRSCLVVALVVAMLTRKVLPNVQEPKRLPTRSILVRYFRMLAKRQR